MKLKKISRKNLNKILDSHKLWLETKGEKGEKANLSYIDLSYIDLTNVNLSHAILYCTRLNYTKLNYTNLSFCNLEAADLTGAILIGTNLFKANLAEANLSNTNLTNANLRETDLYKTNFFYAKIDNMISVGNIGINKRTVYYFYKENRVVCGCFDKTLEKFIGAVKEKYGDDLGEYKYAITLFEMRKEKK